MMKALIAASALPLLAGAANAAEWVPAPGHTTEAPSAVYSETETGTALLTCNAEGQLTAMLSQVTSDFASTIEKPAPYRRSVDVELSGGDWLVDAKWVSLPAIKTIISGSHAHAAKIFNAVIRQEDLTVNVEGKDFAAIDLPGVDATFTAFAKTCKEKR